MINDIEHLDVIMKYKNKYKLFENYFCWLYLFSNENISAFYNYLDFKNKNVLTVTSSGDHALNAFLRGANEIDSFDLNPLAKYFSELKIASIKTLTREEFIMFFNKNLGLFKNSKYFFNKDLYFKKIRNKLDEDNQMFWDYLFDTYNNKKIKKSYLFTDDILSLDGILRINDYLKNDENYYKLRNILLNKKINYYDIDITKLNEINKNYDLIILSNIATSLDNIYNKNHLKCFRDLIEKLKQSNTKIVVSYLYYNCIEYPMENIIYNRNLTDSYFDKSNFEYLSFESTDVFEYPKFFRKDNRKDKILITKN